MPSIAVTDFGPIRRADVELKPLTIFVGGNNSGKSYLALAAYALTQAIGAGRRHGVRFPYFPAMINADIDVIHRFREIMESDEDTTNQLARYFAGDLPFNELPTIVLDWLYIASENWCSVLERDLSLQLRRCFGSTLNQLGRIDRVQYHKDFIIDLQDQENGMKWTTRCVGDGLSTDTWTNKLEDLTKVPPVSRVRSFDFIEDAAIVARFLLREYLQFLIQAFSVRSYYVPATRSGILLGHKTLASLIIGRASSAWIEPLEIERLPGVITDLIQALLNLDSNIHHDNNKDIVEFLESRILNGEVDVEYTVEYPEIQYIDSSGKFQLHQVSSMISEVAPLTLFLKYLVRRGDLFIFEEPESHLNPANQTLIAQAIAMMVNAGIQVLITTHSDIFLHQINNLMAINDSSMDSQIRANYLESQILNPSDVAAYTFKPGSDGTVVERMQINPDFGISTESMDEVHELLYNEAVHLEHEGSD